MRITKQEAMDIAKQAKERAGFGIQNFSGYFIIWEDESDSENNYAVAINKEHDDDGNDVHFCIYVSSPGDENYYEYTDGDSVDELAEELMRIAINIEIAEMRRQGLVVTQV